MNTVHIQSAQSQHLLVNTENKYALIGGGPAGLAASKNLLEHDIKFDGFEAWSDVGGLWNIDNPSSTMYESAHLISSKKMTEFLDFPMPEETADFPHHTELLTYFQEFAREFGIYEHYHFNTRIQKVEPLGKQWLVTLPDGKSYLYKGVIIANGTLSKPNIPEFPGTFTGEILHSSAYKSPKIFDDKRVLIVGGGNSGCDIVVDAVHRASQVSLSLRRGYHFVPKYAFGKPADTIGGKFTLPRKLKQKTDTLLLKMLVGNPTSFGFPAPDHKLYESHPVVNSLVLHYAGHGDLTVRKNIQEFDGKTVVFQDGSHADFDLVVLATGYKLDYPFIDKNHLNWNGKSPDLYLNIFHPTHDNLFVLGMVEAAGIGWQGRSDQAELVCRFINKNEKKTTSAQKFIQRKKTKKPDLSGGYSYMKVERMAYYVHKDTYMKLIHKDMRLLNKQ